jgi:hypothetical protein
MANVDRPRGAILVGTLSGAPATGKIRAFSVDASNGTAIFPGDFVKLEDDGNVAPAAATNAILGVCTGVKVDRSVAATEHPGYLPASTAGTVFVCVDKDAIYEIQEDGNATAAVVGTNADIVAGTGSTTTGMSAHELDSSDATANDASAASAQLRIIGYPDREDNDITATNAKFYVIINEHQLAEGGAGL